MRPSKLSTEPFAPRRSNIAALLFLASLFASAFAPSAARAQAKTETEAEKPAVFCDQTRAVLLVEQELSGAKSFENPVKRIAVMVGAADLLWPHQEERARSLFAEAFELASAHFREKGDEIRREPGRPDSPVVGLTVQLPDQRFVVLRAVGRRDAAWARRLAEQAAEETRLVAEKKGKAGDASSRQTSQKLLALAETLLPSDPPTALSLARLSLRETVTSFLPRFLYKLAEVDRRAADALYVEALAAHAGRDLEELLHLSPYPFALRGALGPVSGLYNVPQGFATSTDLQRQYVSILLRRTGRRLAALEKQPPPSERATGRSEAETTYAVLLMLEKFYGPRDAAESALIAGLKTQAAALLDAVRQERAASYQRNLSGGPPEHVDNFDATIERAQSHATPEQRDRFIALAIMSASQGVKLERVESALQKISDAETRRQLSDWLYFSRAQHALKNGELDEADRLAERVGALDQSALLSLEIAAEGLKRFSDKQRADEILGGVHGAARKAPDTEAKARALLGVAHLYAKFDYVRGAEVLAEAVKTVNLLAEPDFSTAVLHRKVQGKSFSSFTSHPVPGFNLENVFRELGPHDFEGALAVARRLEDKHLRALATNALSARCLEEAPPDELKKRATPPTKKSASASKP